VPLERIAQSNSDLIAAYLDAVMRQDGSFVEHFTNPLTCSSACLKAKDAESEKRSMPTASAGAFQAGNSNQKLTEGGSLADRARI
jgi:hypothetical protein